MKKYTSVIIAGILTAVCLMGCGQKASLPEEIPAAEAAIEETQTEDITEEKEEVSVEDPVEEEISEEKIEAEENALPDGVYKADFDTDSSMFRINETCDGKGVLTVKDGEMTIHITLLSQKILNLYYGLADDAEKEGAQLIEPTVDEVTYSDGMTEEVYGFDVPVPYLNDEFDVALIGSKGKWYDHKVSVSNPVSVDEDTDEVSKDSVKEQNSDALLATVTMTGGTGKAYIESPAVITEVDGKYYATIVWSSKNYDYMIVDGEKILNEAEEGEPSVFTIPVASFDTELTVIGDTVAMSTPHEIEYVLTFSPEQ